MAAAARRARDPRLSGRGHGAGPGAGAAGACAAIVSGRPDQQRAAGRTSRLPAAATTLGARPSPHARDVRTPFAGVGSSPSGRGPAGASGGSVGAAAGLAGDDANAGAGRGAAAAGGGSALVLGGAAAACRGRLAGHGERGGRGLVALRSRRRARPDADGGAALSGVEAASLRPPAVQGPPAILGADDAAG